MVNTLTYRRPRRDSRLARRRKVIARRWRRRFRVEPLEPRLVLDGAPVISEFLADNNDSLTDEDGDSSDWIEIFNPTSAAIELAGWRLTDDPQQLNKWTFPAASLQPGDRMLVFASDKDRAAPGQPLHTNFRLDRDGDYLALVSADGAIVQDFGPQYPPQVSDISYGIAEQIRLGQLVESGSAVRYLVPADESLENSWFDNSLDDSSWSSGDTAIGYDTSVPGYLNVVRADDPVAYWRLSETGDNLSQMLNRAILSDGYSRGLGGLANSASVLFGGSGSLRGENSLLLAEANTAARFDGFDDHVHIPDNAAFGNSGSPVNHRTLEMWFQADAAPGAGSPNRQVLWEDGDQTGGFNLYLHQGEIYMGAWSNNVGNWISAPVLSNQTYHVVFTFDAVGNRILGYLNGQQIADRVISPISAVAIHPGDNAIGGVKQDTRFHNAALLGNGSYFDGVIDEVAVYTRVLNEDAVALHYESGLSGQSQPALLAYWPFDVATQGGAATPDLTGRHDGAVIGATLTSGQGGRVGEAMRFDGQDDYIDAGVISELTTADSFSISLWFWRETDRFEDASNHGVNNVLIAHSSDAANDNFELGSQGGNIETYFDTIELDGPNPSLSQPAGVVNQQWHHVALVYDKDSAAEVALYVDGQLSTQRSDWGGNFDTSGTSPLTIGMARPDASRWGDFQGLIDEVAIWDGPLTASQINSLYNSPASVDVAAGFLGEIQTNLLEAMFEVNPSVYARARFQLEDDPQGIDFLRMAVKYDDGFIAYLNGVEVARRNAPGLARFDSAATASHSDADALMFEEINLTTFGDQLVQGENVLAFQLLNVAADDSDLLFDFQLRTETVLGTADRYFGQPTPGERNNESFLGFVADTKFSVDRGYYEQPFALEITTDTPGAAIVYTTDGSAPSLTTGAAYDGPISINTTTALRAAAFLPGYKPSDIDSHTYLFLGDVIQQPANPVGFPSVWGPAPADYEMDSRITSDPRFADQVRDALTSHPVMSLTIDPADFWDASTGIYANTQAVGREWERFVSVELIDFPDAASEKFNAGIRIQGNASRSTTRPKHNMRLIFRGEYGDSKMEYPLFGDTEVQRFDEIILRGSNGDSWFHPTATQRDQGQYIRDQWLRDTQVDMGQETAQQSYAHLYINGLYWGVYHLIERPVDDFMAEHFGGEKEDYDVIQHRNETIDGDRVAWDEMMAVVRGQNLADDAVYQQVLQYMDATHLIDYMLINFYAGNVDWDHNNWYGGRKREDGATWHFFTWDAERTFINATDNVTGVLKDNQPSEVHQRLLVNDEYRQLFADRVQKYFFSGGALTPEMAEARWLNRADEIRATLIAESARWGDHHRPADPYNPAEEWTAELTRLTTTFFPNRTNTVLGQLDARGLLPSTDAPAFLINNLPQHGGAIAAGDLLSISSSASDVYYTLDGADPRLPGGAINPQAPRYDDAAVLDSSTRVLARARQNGQWSALSEAVYLADNLPALAVSEIMYNAPAEGESRGGPFEYLEFHNPSDEPIDLAALRISDGVEFSFAEGAVTNLAPGEYAVVVSDPTSFSTRYDVTNIKVAGQYLGSLDDNGERLAVTNQFGQTVLAFSYDDSGDWPGRADGTGASLEPLAGAVDLNDSRSWRSSPEYLGSPGRASSAAVGDVVINEVLSHTDFPESDSIELFNTTEQTIDISGWFISDSNNEFRKYRIPNGAAIAPRGYLVFDESDFNPGAGGLEGDFSLDGAHGDDVWLMAANEQGELTRFVDHVEFGAAANGESYGRWPNAGGRLYPMLHPTFAQENAGPRVGPLVISEVMYQPAQGVAELDGDDLEFVEIRNPTSDIVDLTNWQLDDAVEYQFDEGRLLGPHQVLVVLSFNPDKPENAPRVAAFRDHYGIDESVTLVGGYSGRLNNGGEAVRLLRPDEPPLDEPAFTPRLLEDEVRYENESPWPVLDQFPGLSIVRRESSAWGNDGGNWLAAAGTPGDRFVPFRLLSVQVNASQTDPADLPSAAQPSSWIAQRSLIRSIDLTFSQTVAATAADFVLTNLGVNAPAEADQVVTLTDQQFGVSAGNRLSIQFDAATLADGVYELQILPSLTDLYGSSFDGDGDGAPGEGLVIIGDGSNRLYQIASDFNGDRGISIFDFPVFAYWFGSTTEPLGSAPEYVDLNGDRGISIFDFPIFAAGFGSSIVLPTPLSPLAAPDSSSLATRHRIVSQAPPPNQQRLFAAPALPEDWSILSRRRWSASSLAIRPRDAREVAVDDWDLPSPPRGRGGYGSYFLDDPWEQLLGQLAHDVAQLLDAPATVRDGGRRAL